MPPEKNKAKLKGAEAKAAAAAANELSENLANFTLPESLPCSEVSFPVLIHRSNKTNWKAILQESEHKMQEIEEYVQSKTEPVPRSPFQRTECDYIKNEIFVNLLPALEETLNKAKLWNAFQNQRCLFNGIDWIVQLLWNNNPLHPERKFANLHVFNMPWVREYLTHHPRPHYPKSWLWTEDYAATLIQKTVRQYFVQRAEEVQEMRDFWKKLEIEQACPDMELNPYLSRKFASERNIHGPTHDKPEEKKHGKPADKH